MSAIDELKKLEALSGKINWQTSPPLGNERPFEVMPVNPDAVAIVRLFLEKLEKFSKEEREFIIAAIRILTMPMFVWNEKRQAYEPEAPK